MEDSKPPFWISVRFLMGLLLFFGYCFNYMQKIDMSIAIVCMINQTALNIQMKQAQPIETTTIATPTFLSNGSDIAPISYSTTTMNPLFNQSYTPAVSSKDQEKCPMAKTSKNKATHDGPFVWPKSVQGMILSAYFYGYILTQIPGGWLSFRFGGKIVLGLSMGIGSAITMLIPLCASIHYWALIVCLFFTGAAHGSFWPSVSSFWAYWAPTCERSRLVGMASSGAKVGNIIALSLGSVLCLYGFAGGWPSIFYIFGSIGIIWSALFFLLSTDSPKSHWFIGAREKDYILNETKKTIALKEYCQSNVPWKKILTSKACWSIFIGHFSHNWGNYLFLTQTPSFLKDVLKFDLKSNGFIASIPYIASWVFINASSVAVDKVIRSEKCSRTTARRIFSLLGLVLPGVTIIALSFVNCTVVVLGVVLLTLGVAFDSIMMGAGYLVNINDIAGPYSGIVFGLSNTIATLPGIISPNMASAITKHGYQSEWQIVFIISAIVYFIGAVFNFWLLDANIQPWAKIDEQNKDHVVIVNDNGEDGGVTQLKRMSQSSTYSQFHQF